MFSILRRWLGRSRTKAQAPLWSEAVIVSIDGELTFPSEVLTAQVEELERCVIQVVAGNGRSAYQGLEEVSSGLRLVVRTSNALGLCRELTPYLCDSPLRYALSVRWSKEPMSALWHDWKLDVAGPPGSESGRLPR